MFLLAVSFEPDYSYEVTSSQVLPASFTVPLSPVAHVWVPEVNVSHFFQIRTTVQCHTEWYINQTDRRGSGVHTRRALYNITCSGPRLSCDAFIWEEICSSGFPPHPGPEGKLPPSKQKIQCPHCPGGNLYRGTLTEAADPILQSSLQSHIKSKHRDFASSVQAEQRKNTPSLPMGWGKRPCTEPEPGASGSGASGSGASGVGCSDIVVK